MFTLGQYLLSLEDTRGLTRTLGEIEACRDGDGRICYSAGNSAAVFRIRHAGRIRSLRCYLRPMRRLREIYGERLLEKELYVFTSPASGVWADVVIGDWIEGVTLQQAIREAATGHDAERLAGLSDTFDRLAAGLVGDEWAHGDLKPENILVGDDGALHPIDLDDLFLPAFAGQRSSGLGTAAYQHPARTAENFDASLDDYPAALISTALHVLRLDPSLYDPRRCADGLLFHPQHIHSDKTLCEALALFESRGLAVYYRIAELLRAPTLRLPQLARLLGLCAGEEGAGEEGTGEKDARIARAHCGPAGGPTGGPTGEMDGGTDGAPASPPADDGPELFVENGRWGYRCGHRVVVPPLYDCGFDFTEGLAAVRLGQTWHYIDAAGRTAISCPGCEAVKPFRQGRAVVIRKGLRSEIDTEGRTFAI